jgi:cytochrome c oxidase subunit 2
MTNRSPRKRVVLLATGLVAVATIVAGCSGPSNQQNTLKPKGTQAHDINNLFLPVLGVAILILVLIAAGVVYSAIRFRARPGNERPKQTHGHTALEIGWTLIPAVILAVIAVPTVSLIFQLEEDLGPRALDVTVVGKQWWWEFEYAAARGEKKVVTANELHVPVDTPVSLRLQACDQSLPGECNVVHSFWVPELNGKRDVVPGRVNTWSFTPEETGTYLGQCAEYCGLSHANMRFRVIVQTKSEYDDWLAAQRAGPAVALADAGAANRLFSQRFACTNCHTTEDSSVSTYGPNLPHLASRTTFASGYYPLTRKNLIDWVHDAPSLIPMESEDCRIGPPGTPGITCVGMPSFIENTPPGQPTMTREEAATIADYLLELK